jgi:branched-subunit amino acid ABC-type transport system permease component
VDAFLTSRIIADVLGGLTQGVLYGMVALSLVLIWRSTGVLNFAQGAMPMFATYIGFALLSYHVGHRTTRGTRPLRETGN